MCVLNKGLSILVILSSTVLHIYTTLRAHTRYDSTTLWPLPCAFRFQNCPNDPNKARLKWFDHKEMGAPGPETRIAEKRVTAYCVKAEAKEKARGFF